MEKKGGKRGGHSQSGVPQLKMMRNQTELRRRTRTQMTNLCQELGEMGSGKNVTRVCSNILAVLEVNVEVPVHRLSRSQCGDRDQVGPRPESLVASLNSDMTFHGVRLWGCR